MTVDEMYILSPGLYDVSMDDIKKSSQEIFKKSISLSLRITLNDIFVSKWRDKKISEIL
jgi:hypothetical protein